MTRNLGLHLILTFVFVCFAPFLAAEAKAQGSFPQLQQHGYSERVKNRFIVYKKTLKVRQAFLSRPYVRVDYFRTQLKRLCIFGFLYLAQGAEQGMMELFGQEIRKFGFRKIGENPKINRFHTVAHYYSQSGSRKIGVVLGSSNGYISFSIDEVE